MVTYDKAPRDVRLTAYVERPIGALVAALTGPGVDDLLVASAAAAGRLDGTPRVKAHAGDVAWVSGTHARIPVTWSVDGDDALAGTAVIALLVVQSGQQAITELLVTAAVASDLAALAGTLLRHVVDELSGTLEAAVG
ncbi:MAG: hypothetical protein Q8K72_00865 [Acidimicrobiales bacterium]|nr:hypothetical protein [Acidimicrobiales bacterium]